MLYFVQNFVIPFLICVLGVIGIIIGVLAIWTFIDEKFGGRK